jgi:hypothetical protein
MGKGKALERPRSAVRRERRARSARPALAADARRQTLDETLDLAPQSRRAANLYLALAAVAVLALYLAIRLAAREPWDYDEYYHVGVAREMRHHFPLRAFPWTPFSILADAFADKEPLFHALLLPFAGWGLERATLAGVLLGQIGVIAAFAYALRRLRVPGAAGYLLALSGLGSMFALRLEMCRPHVWMITFSVLILALLLGRARLLTLAIVAAVFGLVHVGGWIAIFYAAAWTVVGWRMAGERGRALWGPLVAVTSGFVAGQLVHPNFPANLRLLWTQNVLVPLHSLGAGSAALTRTLGTELKPPPPDLLAMQWPAFAVLALAGLALLRRPALRTRETITLALLALAFLGVATFALSRFFEVGAPLALLALALVAREAVRQRVRLPFPGDRLAAGLGLLVAGLFTVWSVLSLGFGVSYPDEMARWLGTNGAPGEVVFTAQWADSEPLFYYAPQLRSLTVLDPTFFYAKDPALFADYARIAYGESGDPVGEIERRFGARWVTVWKVPAYKPLVVQFLRDRRARIQYNGDYYQVWRLTPGAS